MLKPKTAVLFSTHLCTMTHESDRKIKKVSLYFGDFLPVMPTILPLFVLGSQKHLTLDEPGLGRSDLGDSVRCRNSSRLANH